MIKVVIVDDEKMIREGLQSILPWRELGYEVVAAGANGREGLEHYEQHRPELMIVDIRMPGMSGLELIEAIRKKGGAVRFLILSGYADFEYAKQAIKLQTDGYLLKPVDEDELQQHLLKLRELIEAEAEQRRLSARPPDREQLLRELLDGQAEPAAAKAVGLTWASGRIILLRLNIDSPEGDEIIREIAERLGRRLDEAGRGVVFGYQQYLALAIKCSDAPNAGLAWTKELLEGALEGLHVTWIAAAGDVVADVDGWPTSRATAQALLTDAFRYDGNRILTQYDRPSVPGDVSAESRLFPMSPAALVDTLYIAADAGNLEAARRLLEDTGRQWLAVGIGEQELKSRLAQATASVIHRLAQHRPELAREPGSHAAELLEAYRKPHFSEVIDSVMQTLGAVVTRLDQGTADQQIKRLLDVIHRNYSQQLRLEMLAAAFNYNSAYLGKLFKSKTGEYFNTYLDKVRIEQAKVLLEEGLKVYQVAERVGYLNPDYFHAKFKKYVGVSPTGYRKR